MVQYDILFRAYRLRALVLSPARLGTAMYVDQINPGVRPKSGFFRRAGLEDGGRAAVGGKMIFKGDLGLPRERAAIAPG
jgi:hypothetical protein